MGRSLFTRLGIVSAILALTLPAGVARADYGPGHTNVSCWQRFPAPAQPQIGEVAHGGDGSLWATLLPQQSYGVGRWNGTGWTMFPGIPGTSPVKSLVATPGGQPWVVTHSGNIYRLVGTTWEQAPGHAVWLDIGPSGDIWKTGPERVDLGFSLYQWSSAWGWIPIEVPRPYAAGGVRVDRYGTPWISSFDKIFRRKSGTGGASWFEIGGGGQVTWDMDIGSGEQLWRIVRNQPLADYPIQQLTSSGWVYVEGAGLTISMDRNGRPWHTNSRGEAYFWGGCA